MTSFHIDFTGTDFKLVYSIDILYFVPYIEDFVGFFFVCFLFGFLFFSQNKRKTYTSVVSTFYL